METVKAIFNGAVAAIQSYPKGAMLLWGVSLVAVIVLMWD